MNSCDEIQETAKNLNAAINEAIENSSTHQWGVGVTLPATVSGLDTDQYVSMDVPSIVSVDTGNADGSSSQWIATFHSIYGRDGDGLFALYIAESNVLQQSGELPTEWTVLSKISGRASMGHIYKDEQTGFYYLAYELNKDDASGITIAIRRYATLDHLKTNTDWKREIQLDQWIRPMCVPFPVPVANLGTPTIERIDNTEKGKATIHLRFHYFPAFPQTDLPGSGLVVFPNKSEGIYQDVAWDASHNWNDYQAIRNIGAVGKIGMRTALNNPSNPDGQALFLYEAQMANNGEGYYGWLSWRPILVSPGCQETSALVPILLDQNLQTFANPQISRLGTSGYLAVSFFIPTQPFDQELTDTYQSFEPVKDCPTCASNPMLPAQAPARAGTLLMILKEDTVFPSTTSIKNHCDEEKGFGWRLWSTVSTCAFQVQTCSVLAFDTVCNNELVPNGLHA